MKKNLLSTLIFDGCEILVAIFLVIGINFWFNACGAKDDGTYMNCHNALVIVKALSYLLLSLSIIKCIIPYRNMKAGISIGIFGSSLIMILVPNTLINLCQMDMMVCNSSMKPWTLVFGILFMTYSLLEIIYALFKARKNK